MKHGSVALFVVFGIAFCSLALCAHAQGADEPVEERLGTHDRAALEEAFASTIPRPGGRPAPLHRARAG